MVARRTPCVSSVTSSRLGHLVALIRRLRSTSASSGARNSNGQIAVFSAAAPTWADCASTRVGSAPMATATADVASSTAAELLRRDIVILLGDQASTLFRREV